MRNFIKGGLVVAILAGSGVALADVGTTDFGPTPEMSAQGAYLGLDLGGANVKYADTVSGSTSSWDFGNWSLAAGGNVGYQFSTYMALELGGAYILPSKSGGMEFKPWFAYTAAKIMVPLYRNATLFAKAGINYLSQHASGTPAGYAGKAKDSTWGPMFAIGASYAFNDNWSTAVTYTRLGGNESRGHMIPDFNIVSGSIVYKFTI
jgi:hypothetical protein